MTNAYIAAGFMVCVGVLGYVLGRYQSDLVNKIRTLEQGSREPEPEKPTVLMGTYEPPVSTHTDESRDVGLVEAKTPELVDWEIKQKVEKEALGR